MGDRPREELSGRSTVRRTRAERARNMSAVYAVMAAIILLILLQFLLLMVGIECFLAGKRVVLGPAALGSGVCFAAACWLIRYVTPPAAGSLR